MTDETISALRRRVEGFIGNPASDRFGDLALAVFRLQHERVPAYRRLCDARGVDPVAVTDWRDLPAVPALAFKTLELAVAPAVETFRSSGTRGARSTHLQPFPGLYRHAIDCSFPRFCLAGLERPPILALVSDREQLPDSSLSFMADHVVERWGGERSVNAFGPRGVDASASRSWLSTQQRSGQPCLVFATSFALAQLLDALARRQLRFRLAPGSVVFDTGGFKGRTRELERRELLDRIADYLGVGDGQVVREYGMTELTSQCYTDRLAGGDDDVFVPPHWLRPQVLDPETLDPAAAGETGLLAFVDLANLGSALHVLTEDLGVAVGDDGRFRLVGRASDAELRGCSLTVEELAAAGKE